MAFPTITSRSRRRATTCVLTFITSTAVLTSLSPLTAASRHLCHRSAHLFTRSSSPSLAPSLTPATRTRTYVHSRSNSATSISMSCSHPADDSDLYGGGEGTLVKAANDNPSAAIIFLHGLGDTGTGWANAFPLPSARHAFTILPNANVTPVTLNGGMPMPSWFDLYGLSESTPDDKAGIQYAVHRIHRIIDLCSQSLPSDRIIVAGFSQGGALALTAALTYPKKLAGVVALSTWLPLRDSYPEKFSEHAKQTPVFFAHGEDDNIVPTQFGQKSAQRLKELGIEVTFKTYSNMAHSASQQEMSDVDRFVERLIPRKD